MDYKKIYYQLCNYCKDTDVVNRIINRNKNDERLNTDKIYTEVHHIIPKHAKGSNDKNNLVAMLPEEHYIAHLLRYKAYNDRNYFLSIRLMMNGYNSKNFISTKLKNKFVKLFKMESVDFRKKHGWQTENGRKRISLSRTGKMPVRDKETGIMIGSVDINHEKIKNGEWIHHTKGKLSVKNKLTGEKIYLTSDEYQLNKNLYISNNGDSSGVKNSRYSGYTDEQIVDYVIELSNIFKLGIIIPYKTCIKYYITKNILLPKSLSKFRFNNRNLTGLYEQVLNKTNLIKIDIKSKKIKQKYLQKCLELNI